MTRQMRRSPGQNLGAPAPFQTPVSLPAGIDHASHVAYNKYKCRCRLCVLFRRDYDRATWEIRKARRAENG